MGRILKYDLTGRNWVSMLYGVGRILECNALRVLSDLEVGEVGVLVALDLPPGVQNHLMYMGFVPDARVKAVHRAPAGDPTVYSVDGIEIALRRETAKAIRLQKPLTQKAEDVARAESKGKTKLVKAELAEAAR
jgi:ferrous iron transport protein A